MTVRGTYAISTSDKTAREAEVSGADFDNGCNLGGSGSGVIGIDVDDTTPIPLGDDEGWTLPDQYGNATRAPQTSDYIGNTGYVNRASVDWVESGGSSGEPANDVQVMDPDAYAGTGEADALGDATLLVVATGWAVVV